ncbi:MAG: hypothetical protein HY962_16415 [Ignavibacteriae bacterium]|nr:hypothetical protein [Ignavibacteriota bacterium]
MLRTEHILYRISQELSSPIEQVALAYGSIVTAVHTSLAAGRRVDCGRLGLLSLHEGQIVKTHAAQDVTDTLRFDVVLREYCVAADFPAEAAERVREQLLLHVSDALDRRESVTLQDLGIWHPAARDGVPAFVPAPLIVPELPRGGASSVTATASSGTVDVSRLIAEVHREMGFDPPGDTLEPGAIDVAALIRVVRNNLPELPDDGASDTGTSRLLRSLATESRASATGLGSDGPFVEAESAGDFERNREQLFHPPEQKHRQRKSAASILAMLFLVILIVAVAWFAGFFDEMFSSPVVGMPPDAAPSAIHQYPQSFPTTEHVS